MDTNSVHNFIYLSNGSNYTAIQLTIKTTATFQFWFLTQKHNTDRLHLEFK